jgi:steroid delta-isomerase
MSMRGALAWLALVALLAPAVARADPAAESAIRATLARWTDDFNARRVDRICDLFAAELRYDYRGFEERGFDDICDLLRKSLADDTRTFNYEPPRVKEILVSGDLAVVRLVWKLIVRPAGAEQGSVSVEPGMDVFRRQSDGSWKIVRYIAYEE